MPPLITEQHAITGPAGELEAVLEMSSSTEPRGMALVCHPHPLHGGTLSNKVVYTLARAFVDLGAASLRFNFRGVGASAGQYADGVGEVDDAIAAANWLRDRWPGLPFFLGGFSFGAAVALHAAAVLRPHAVVTVALPFARITESAVEPDVPWLAIHGSGDTLIPVDELVEWIGHRARKPTLDVIAGADHFFHGKLAELRSSIERFFAPLLGAEHGKP